MHYKTNRRNHDFQIAYFLAGSCHTPDGAYALMCDLREERDNAIKSYAASKLREEAKIIRAQNLISKGSKADRLDGQADLIEIEAMKETVEKNLAAAIAERATIDKCMLALEPLRKYKHLPLPEAHQACQEEEWKLELIHRAENFLLTMGTIPTDHFSTMRMHPAFSTEILPAVNNIQNLLRNGKVDAALALCLAAPEFDVPKLLGISLSKKEA